MVCKKHGVPSDASLRLQGLEPDGVLVPKWAGGPHDPHLSVPPWQYTNCLTARRRFQFPGPSIGTHRGVLCSRHDTWLVVEACMSGDPELNEWYLLLDQFHALIREGSDSIEDIFNAEFRRRLSKFIDQAVGADWQLWDDGE